ncbi:dihydropteroate synthase [Desulfobotulus mexicanus]|nr:dihydropteroate synthase [Desulfobotulus mexicanus]
MPELMLQTARTTLSIKGRCALMGIINCTPDSFSDGGRFIALEKALTHARNLIAEGADILDVGGESTRPFATQVSAEEECRRVIPLIRELRRETNLSISIDTRKASVAKAAIEAGADIINDISALEDPDMLPLCTDTGAALVLMHMQGTPATMQLQPRYSDVVREVSDYLRTKSEQVLKSGIAANRIVLDPGIGFGKNLQDNLKLLANLSTLNTLGFPLLLGTSRKKFIRALSASHHQEPDVLSMEVLAGTLATSIAGFQSGASILRIHDVAATRATLQVYTAICNAAPSGTFP